MQDIYNMDRFHLGPSSSLGSAGSERRGKKKEKCYKGVNFWDDVSNKSQRWTRWINSDGLVEIKLFPQTASQINVDEEEAAKPPLNA